MTGVELHHGDSRIVLPTLDAGSVDCCVTSPPYYGLRDYGVAGQIGAEATPAEYVENLSAVFAEVHRVLAADGTLWLNLGDSYAGSAGGSQGASGQRARRTFTATGLGGKGDIPAKNLLGMPWRVAFALQDAGWILRNAIIWAKPNAIPESVVDRLSARYEMVFMFSKSKRYWFDLAPIREKCVSAIHPRDDHKMDRDRDKVPRLNGQQGTKLLGATGHIHASNPAAYNPAGKNPGDVWTIATTPFAAAHFATFPPELPRRCILAGCKPGGTVLDPFHGSGTTGMVARQLGRGYVGIELNREYIDLSLTTRLKGLQ
jgi:site-specific DNA-methyltransferase (cytosine-N4-specific)